MQSIFLPWGSIPKSLKPLDTAQFKSITSNLKHWVAFSRLSLGVRVDDGGGCIGTDILSVRRYFYLGFSVKSLQMLDTAQKSEITSNLEALGSLLKAYLTGVRVDDGGCISAPKSCLSVTTRYFCMGFSIESLLKPLDTAQF
jgi:hypothetical protein